MGTENGRPHGRVGAARKIIARDRVVYSIVPWPARFLVNAAIFCQDVWVSTTDDRVLGRRTAVVEVLGSIRGTVHQSTSKSTQSFLNLSFLYFFFAIFPFWRMVGKPRGHEGISAAKRNQTSPSDAPHRRVQHGEFLYVGVRPTLVC